MPVTPSSTLIKTIINYVDNYIVPLGSGFNAIVTVLAIDSSGNLCTCGWFTQTYDGNIKNLNYVAQIKLNNIVPLNSNILMNRIDNIYNFYYKGQSIQLFYGNPYRLSLNIKII